MTRLTFLANDTVYATRSPWRSLSAAILPHAGAQTFHSDVSNTGGGIDYGAILGVSAKFYNAGYTGKSAIVSNIEGGFFYKYHPDLLSQTTQLAYGGAYPAPLGPDPNDPSARTPFMTPI